MSKVLLMARLALMAAFVALAAVGFLGQGSSASASAAGVCDGAGCIGGNLNCYSPPGGGMCYTHEHHDQ